ncbi:putative DNA binding domain-containing protein [Pseudomonas balearica]|uniref:ATP-binding protein n=1 Tax=Stutzerimonas balearica TaxID=74829 RepID=UPI001F253397|nr:ATP-binding protein [Stutzerimonas balearica]MCF6758394.1 putative DNA binding domain-containing protein [Stutzerimonas balearica]
MDQVLTMTETETVELKKSLAELKQGLISLAAMLNKHGQAELWFGIAPNGKAVGLEINEKTLRDVSQAITAHIEPAIYPHITQQRIDGKHCLHIKAEGWQQPYLAYGRAYMRVADEDKKLSASELKNLILQNNQDALRWENEPSGLTLEQLNPEKISRFLALADLPPDSAASALEKLDLLRQGVPLNAAKLFFSDAPIQLRCAVFATHTSSTIIDRHDFDGDILELIEEAEKYALKNIHIGMRLEGLRRVDVPEIPLKAIREALVNAFCHRDWRDPDFVQVAVFRDRLEIRSPGKLYGGLTFDEIRQGNISRRRNPKIAELLRRIHLVEAWGRGVPLILENAPSTSFDEIGGLFITRFNRPSALDASQDAPAIRPETSLKTTQELPQATQETTQELPRTTQEILLQHLRSQPGITTVELARVTGLSPDGVKYHLNQLKRTGKLRRHGPTKGGYWEVVTKADE